MTHYLILSLPRSGTHYLRHLLRCYEMGNPMEIQDDDLSKAEPNFLFRQGEIYSGTVWPHQFLEVKRLLRRNNRDVPIKFIYLHRIDRVRQAISFMKGRQSGAWSSDNAVHYTFDYKYDYDLIMESLISLSLREQNWFDVFSEFEIEPFIILYEQLVADPSKTLRDIASYLDLETEVTIEQTMEYLSRPDVPKKQRDGLTDQFVKQFHKDFALRSI